MQDEGIGGQAEPEMGGAAAPQQPASVRPTHVERINSGWSLTLSSMRTFQGRFQFM